MQTPPPHYHLQFSDRQFYIIGRVLLALLLFAAALVVMFFMRNLLAPLVISIFLAYLLEPAVAALENRGLDRVWAILLVFLGLAALAATIFLLLRAEISSEVQTILAHVQLEEPGVLVEQIKDKLRQSFPGATQARIIDMIGTVIRHFFFSFFKPGVEGVLELFSTVGGLIIVPFLTFFILKDSRSLQNAIVQRIPNRYFEMSLSLFHKASQQLGRYIRGVLLDGAIVGLLVMIALSLLDLRYAVFIGMLAGMANLIPYLGPVLGGIPAIAVSVIDRGNFSGVPAVLLAFAVVKIIDDFLIQPYVVSKSVALHPVVVILAIYVGGNLAGILGMIVAVPVVAIIKGSIEILHWGFSEYYIFRLPEFAFAHSEQFKQANTVSSAPAIVAAPPGSHPHARVEAAATAVPVQSSAS
ncbi:MAG: AI-2E family transporter [candidate division KSB1 bacterium]|nr:AI-2E family transporter [candidate division KSB1 bacterium]MDZ7272599.1 AI-2E family transporter [candidate division KSB1 bacterium]MDZ7284378.1 AI-2E family transporter [candidate division KSB1 bacterium]MDZ7297226.1 AI-2E family transporter [candidate division KSB1 bacterium]MDZ7308547.1 AI-2E family transporter [candidate division KSB1 bacterium]